MNAAKPTSLFLSAEWRDLVMLNFEIDPKILQPLAPNGTELDHFKGRTLVSLVGFMFLNTRVRGFGIPFHKNFEEINLRFYVLRREGPELRRGVVFIKEIVPRMAITAVARWIYNENYVTMAMRHTLQRGPTEIRAAYEFRHARRWNSLSVTCAGEPALPVAGSEAEFITEHYWGYARQRDGGCMEYKVEHPQWRLWTASDARLDADARSIYGERFAPALSARPVSAFLVEGSPITVSQGWKIC
jgi:uncharacterized protein YqjF (DUF2071 family)